MGVYDGRLTALERAFELAKSGHCSSIEEILQCLKLEGYPLASMEGFALRDQLRAIIREARGEPVRKTRTARPATGERDH